jgi:hypothetical protein
MNNSTRADCARTGTAVAVACEVERPKSSGSDQHSKRNGKTRQQHFVFDRNQAVRFCVLTSLVLALKLHH